MTRSSLARIDPSDSAGCSPSAPDQPENSAGPPKPVHLNLDGPKTDRPRETFLHRRTQSQTLPTLLHYALITPARNEAEFIETAIQSVVAQTVRPLKWVIVSDGSTDATDDIVSKYAAEHSWIELVQMPPRRERHFAGKVDAFNAGYARLKGLPYNVVGNLDADVSFDDKNYFEFVMQRFAENSRLGVCGTAYREGESTYPYRFTSLEDVPGACQMFRRECFEAIGGYLPLPSGGIDVIAVFSAQAAGWQTRTFTEKSFLHHRKVGAAQNMSVWSGFLRTGEKDYILGSHPVWELMRSVYLMKNRPYVIGGVLMLAGYIRALLWKADKAIPREFMQRRRQQQMQRLQGIARDAFRSRAPASRPDRVSS